LIDFDFKIIPAKKGKSFKVGKKTLIFLRLCLDIDWFRFRESKNPQKNRSQNESGFLN